MTKEPIEEDPTSQALTDYQITMSLRGLLNLVPQFRETWTTCATKDKLSIPWINFSQPSEGPEVQDEQNPAVKVIVKGKEVLCYTCTHGTCQV